MWDKRKLRNPEEQPDLSLPSGKSSWSPITLLFGHRLSGGSISVSFATTRKRRKLLNLWMERAYRRPVKTSESNPFSHFTKSSVGTA